MSRSKGRKRVDSPARTDREALIASWGAPVDDELLELALTHRSWAFENGGVPTNERLEFLGDSVLSIIVTERIYRDFPDKAESELVPIRAAAVSEEPLAEIAKEIGLGQFILLGNGELVTGGRSKASILSDAMEALIAATFLTGGLESVRPIIEKFTAPFIAKATTGPRHDWKTEFSMLATELGFGDVTYEIIATGPDHAKRYEAIPHTGERTWVAGQGTSRAKAEMAAAEASHPVMKAAGA